ncbi:MAG: hypothetical protein HY365_02940 [Candidatus Aenigmarchaeota archaeon]|nr:hypothetical protein [Candidatus Aenigmarchaeota archaeon]
MEYRVSIETVESEQVWREFDVLVEKIIPRNPYHTEIGPYSGSVYTSDDGKGWSTTQPFWSFTVTNEKGDAYRKIGARLASRIDTLPNVQWAKYGGQHPAIGSVMSPYDMDDIREGFSNARNVAAKL